MQDAQNILKGTPLISKNTFHVFTFSGVAGNVLIYLYEK